VLKESSAQFRWHQRETHFCECEWRYLPLEGLVDTLRSICMFIMPTENPISALRLTGAVALNIAGNHSTECCFTLLEKK